MTRFCLLFNRQGCSIVRHLQLHGRFAVFVKTPQHLRTDNQLGRDAVDRPAAWTASSWPGSVMRKKTI